MQSLVNDPGKIAILCIQSLALAVLFLVPKITLCEEPSPVLIGQWSTWTAPNSLVIDLRADRRVIMREYGRWSATDFMGRYTQEGDRLILRFSSESSWSPMKDVVDRRKAVDHEIALLWGINDAGRLMLIPTDYDWRFFYSDFWRIEPLPADWHLSRHAGLAKVADAKAPRQEPVDGGRTKAFVGQWAQQLGNGRFHSFLEFRADGELAMRLSGLAPVDILGRYDVNDEGLLVIVISRRRTWLRPQEPEERAEKVNWKLRWAINQQGSLMLAPADLFSDGSQTDVGFDFTRVFHPGVAPVNWQRTSVLEFRRNAPPELGVE